MGFQNLFVFLLGALVLELAQAKVVVQYLSSPMKVAVIKVEGIIALGEDIQLKQAIETVRRKGYKLKLNAIQFSSHGGNGHVARLMGEVIRENELYTFVGVRAECASACVYAFAGGVVRMAYGRIQVHRPTYLETLDVGYLNDSLKDADRDVSKYIKKMGLSSHLTEAILSTPNWAIRELEGVEKRRWGLHGMDRYYEERWFRASAKKFMMSLDEFIRHYVKHWKTCNDVALRKEKSPIECTEELVKSSS